MNTRRLYAVYNSAKIEENYMSIVQLWPQEVVKQYLKSNQRCFLNKKKNQLWARSTTISSQGSCTTNNWKDHRLRIIHTGALYTYPVRQLGPSVHEPFLYTSFCSINMKKKLHDLNWLPYMQAAHVWTLLWCAFSRLTVDNLGKLLDAFTAENPSNKFSDHAHCSPLAVY